MLGDRTCRAQIHTALVQSFHGFLADEALFWSTIVELKFVHMIDLVERVAAWATFYGIGCLAGFRALAHAQVAVAPVFKVLRPIRIIGFALPMLLVLIEGARELNPVSGPERALPMLFVSFPQADVALTTC